MNRGTSPGVVDKVFKSLKTITPGSNSWLPPNDPPAMPTSTCPVPNKLFVEMAIWSRLFCRRHVQYVMLPPRCRVSPGAACPLLLFFAGRLAGPRSLGRRTASPCTTPRSTTSPTRACCGSWTPRCRTAVATLASVMSPLHIHKLFQKIMFLSA